MWRESSSPNAGGMTSLHVAAPYDESDIGSLLLASTADPQDRTAEGVTPFQLDAFYQSQAPWVFYENWTQTNESEITIRTPPNGRGARVPCDRGRARAFPELDR